MSGRVLRVGIVGCGRAAALHAGALARLPGLEVAALADVDAEACRALAARCGSPPCFPSAAELLAGAPVDVVAVCVPPAEHAAVAATVLAAGRHLLVEKPIALTLDEADRMVADAAAHPLVATIGFNLRWHRQVRAARALLADGRVGRVQLVRSQWTAELASVLRATAWRRQAASGGGVLSEFGTHHVDLWGHLLGDELVDVTARAALDGDADAVAGVLARTRAGVLVSATFSQSSSDSNELELVGDAGRLQLALYRGDGPHLRPRGRAGGGVRTRATEGVRGLADLPRQAWAARHGGDYLASFAAEWAAVAAAVRGEHVALPTLADGREALRVTLAALASAQEGRP